MSSDRLTHNFAKLLGADTARITRPCGKWFLIIGTKRHTRDTPGIVCLRNGVPYEYDYVEEQVVASGNNEKELYESVLLYKKLVGMTWEEFFKELK